MTESFRLTAIGIVVGFALSVAAATVWRASCTESHRPIRRPIAGVFVLLTVASLLACYLPARRAASPDPMVVLRTE